MPEIKHPSRGSTAVEFAVLAIVFFTFVFGVMELARALYLINTLQEVTRRAASMAANSQFNTATIGAIRSAALFPDGQGNLVLGTPITPAHVKIEYLSISKTGTTLAMQPITTMPSCPARNRLNCLADPYGASCIRLIRASICQPDGATLCTAVPYQMLFPFVDLSRLKLPQAQTIVPAQTLGYTFGAIPCP